MMEKNSKISGHSADIQRTVSGQSADRQRTFSGLSGHCCFRGPISADSGVFRGPRSADIQRTASGHSADSADIFPYFFCFFCFSRFDLVLSDNLYHFWFSRRGKESLLADGRTASGKSKKSYFLVSSVRVRECLPVCMFFACPHRGSSAYTPHPPAPNTPSHPIPLHPTPSHPTPSHPIKHV